MRTLNRMTKKSGDFEGVNWRFVFSEGPDDIAACIECMQNVHKLKAYERPPT